MTWWWRLVSLKEMQHMCKEKWKEFERLAVRWDWMRAVTQFCQELTNMTGVGQIWQGKTYSKLYETT